MLVIRCSLKTNHKTRPSGVTATAWLFFFAAAACALTAAFTMSGAWPLAWGRYLVADMVTMGPFAFIFAAVAYAVIAVGLLALKNWARRLAIVAAAVGLYFLVPAISSAVADFRIGGIAINGAQIILRVVVMWYLMQQSVAEAFDATSAAPAA